MLTNKDIANKLLNLAEHLEANHMLASAMHGHFLEKEVWRELFRACQTSEMAMLSYKSNIDKMWFALFVAHVLQDQKLNLSNG